MINIIYLKKYFMDSKNNYRITDVPETILYSSYIVQLFFILEIY